MGQVPNRPGDLVAWAIRTKRISPERGQEYLRAAANGADVSYLVQLTPAPEAIAQAWGRQQGGMAAGAPAEADEFAHLFPPKAGEAAPDPEYAHLFPDDRQVSAGAEQLSEDELYRRIFTGE